MKRRALFGRAAAIAAILVPARGLLEETFKVSEQPSITRAPVVFGSTVPMTFLCATTSVAGVIPFRYPTIRRTQILTVKEFEI